MSTPAFANTPSLTLRPSNARGHLNHGWLDTYHTFSFGEYHDAKHMGFRALRVINEDFVAPGAGFPTHAHNDMEIITYIIDGELAHKDSMGNGSTIKTGEVQAMSAGSGIRHSEYNPSDTKPVHLLQIWILPHTKSVTPRYAERKPVFKDNAWTLIAAEKETDHTLPIHQDAQLFIAKPKAGETLQNPVPAGRYGWLQVAQGEVEINGQVLRAGDGASFTASDWQALAAKQDSALLCFDLA